LGYPKPIQEVFPGVPGELDAAVQWGVDQKLYFFKDDHYYSFDPSETDPVPEKTAINEKNSHWKGLQANVDAAFQWNNGKTYFVDGIKYNKYDDANRGVSLLNLRTTLTLTNLSLILLSRWIVRSAISDSATSGIDVKSLDGFTKTALKEPLK